MEKGGRLRPGKDRKVRKKILLLLFQDAFEDLGHIVDLIEDGFADENGLFLLQGENHGIAGAGIDFDELDPEFVFLPEDNAGEEGAVVEVVDDDALEVYSETAKDVTDEVVGEGAFPLLLVNGHGNGVSDPLVDIDDKSLVLRSKENGTAVSGGHDTFDRSFDDVVIHIGHVLKKGGDPQDLKPISVGGGLGWRLGVLGALPEGFKEEMKFAGLNGGKVGLLDGVGGFEEASAVFLLDGLEDG